VLEGKTVGVVVPAYNEEKLVASTIEQIPAFVDRILVVDDGSTDDRRAGSLVGSARRADLSNGNHGVGAAIVSGYRRDRAGNRRHLW
jgi:glycosyltransferase involved in cell wall biosynthesis